MRNVGFSLCLVAAAALTGCGKNSTGSERSGAVNQSVIAQYLNQHGQNLDACFAGKPVMADPGLTQGVADGRPRPVAVNRLIVALDSSGSMAARSGGSTKLDISKNAVTTFLTGVPANTQVGLVVFGHRGTNTESGKAASCQAVETLYPLGSAKQGDIARAMQSAKATGWTPLAAAISKAGGSFAPGQTPGAQVVYVVSDGLETCGGDPVAAARALHTGQVRAVVNIIGLDLAANDRAQLKAVADAGGGTFIETSVNALGQMLDDLQRKAASVSAITTERFDAGGRVTDNNMAAGRYVTKVNQCLTKGTALESSGLSQSLTAQATDPAVREVALEALRKRHDGYREQGQRIAADLDARRAAANAAIETQIRGSEARLGQKP